MGRDACIPCFLTHSIGGDRCQGRRRRGEAGALTVGDAYATSGTYT